MANDTGRDPRVDPRPGDVVKVGNVMREVVARKKFRAENADWADVIVSECEAPKKPKGIRRFRHSGQLWRWKNWASIRATVIRKGDDNG
jgi:hypothetical protein